MKITTRLTYVLLFGLFQLCLMLPLAQASVQMQFLELEPGSGMSGIKIHNSTLAIQTVSAGGLKWDTEGDDANTPPLTFIAGTDDILTFCIELGQFAYRNAHSPYEKNPVAGAPDPYVSSLPTGAHIGGQRADLLDLLADNYWDDAIADLTGNSAVAFQLAIWEIVHESTSLGDNDLSAASLGLSYGEGSFYVANTSLSAALTSVLTLANGWLESLDPSSTNPLFPPVVHDDNLSLYALTNPDKQDQIYQYIDVGTDIASVPEPISLLVWGGIGLLSLGCIRTRKTMA